MLILTRRCGESLKIGEDIDVIVLACTGSQVRIGIRAPLHVDVHREEIYTRIQQDKKKALSEGKAETETTDT